MAARQTAVKATVPISRAAESGHLSASWPALHAAAAANVNRTAGRSAGSRTGAGCNVGARKREARGGYEEQDLADCGGKRHP